MRKVFLKRQVFIPFITLVLLIILLISTIVFAWMSYVDRKGMGEFEADEFHVVVKVNDQVEVNNIKLNDLAFIDYEKDFILDKYHTLNQLASIVTITVENGENSIYLKNQIEIAADNGLLYMIVLGEDGSDYYGLVHSFITDIAIEEYNDARRISLQNRNIAPGASFTFRIIVWGDYNSLEDKENYLNNTYQMNVRITSIQSGRGVQG